MKNRIETWGKPASATVLCRIVGLCNDFNYGSRLAGALSRCLLPLLLVLLAALPCAGQLAARKGEVPDDEAKKAGKKPEDFIPKRIENYFRGMDAVSVPGGAVSTSWPDQLLDKLGSQARQGRNLVDVVQTTNEVFGRNTWMLWCGGNEAFWDWLANHSLGFMDLLKLLDSRKRTTRWRDGGLVNEPGMKEAAKPDEWGLWLDEPDASDGQRYAYPPPEEIYGRSSGIVGLRLFPNLAFLTNAAARKKWDARRYYEDSRYFSDPKLIRPYRVGMSCAFCHASAHPLRPPLDPARPRWENLSGSIGSQYLRIRSVFGNLLPTNNFVYHLLDSQPPGTIDTSLIASDNINNPNTMNAVFGVPQRVQRAAANPLEVLSGASSTMPVLDRNEAVPYANPRPVPRILLDGADSVGVWGALARVYLNIGTFHEQWIRLHEPLVGFLTPQAAAEGERRTQLPFKIEDCQEHSVYWQATRLRVEALRDYFLKVTPSMPLMDAEGGPVHRVDTSKLARGRRVFAKNCIVCHSSLQPESAPMDLFESDPSDVFHGRGETDATLARMDTYSRAHAEVIKARKYVFEGWARSGEFWDHDPGRWLRDTNYAAWALDVVELPEFWRNNFLSTDNRVPVTYVGTNPGRALGNNATAGHMWEDFSSDSYRKLPSVGALSYFNPYKGREGGDDTFTPRHHVETNTPAGGGGPGFYRPPTLISIWATAPLLHNNSLGHFNNDPSTKGRLEAFDDAIRKLLWPERRLQHSDYASSEQLKRDHGLIWRTPCATELSIPGKHAPEFARRLPLPHWFFNLAERIDQLGRWRYVPSAVLFLAAFAVLFLPAFKSMQKRAQCRKALRQGPPAKDQKNEDFGEKVRLIRLVRYGAYVCLVLALGLGFLASFVSGGFGDLRLGPIPAGTPVNLFANLNPEATKAELKEALGNTLAGLTEVHVRHLKGADKDRVFQEKIAPTLLAVSKCPDFVMDKGHFFPWFRDMSDEDKEALIELLKTF